MKGKKKGTTGEQHIHAREWHLVSPQGVSYVVKNLNHFLRENPGLFSPDDVLWKRRRGGNGGTYCNAASGLSNVSQGKNSGWKGWTLPGAKMRKHRIDWEAVDWTKPTNQLADELGVLAVTVSAARKRHARDTVRTRRKNFRPGEWTRVDWSKSDRELAEEMGCSISPVRVARARHAPAD